MNFYFPKNEINSLKGATTAGYENAVHSDLLNNRILHQMAQKSTNVENVNFPAKRQYFYSGKNFPMHKHLFDEKIAALISSLGLALENSSHVKKFSMRELISRKF